jgi:septal ring factor EnvC (AmiA/AmiB activator)
VLIHQRKDQQVVRKDQKNDALQTQTKQVQELSVQRKEKDAVVKQLKSKEKELQNQMAAKKKRDRDLQNAILAIVKREIEDAKRKAKMEADAKAKEAATKNATTKATPTGASTTSATTASTSTTAATTAGTTTSKRNEPVSKPDSYLDFTAKDVALNSSFQANRGKLPWPVDNGYVTLHYGPNKIENTKLTIDNPGLTIATPKAGATVRAVFEGEVSGIYNLGEGMTLQPIVI